MEVKELMIGDYVNYRGQIIKVTSLYDKGDSNEVGWSDKESVWVNADNVEPIPLTAEILEKNGFEFMTGLWYLTTKERKPIQIVFKDNNVITLSINATPVPIGLKYVHQLQHALKLYGIEKEFEL